jgi:putative intracellular protease/amidase
VLLNVRDRDGAALVAGRRVTGFTNDEEAAVELTDVVPFLLESELKGQGAAFSRAASFEAHVVTDDRLVTGQNPASSEPAAQAVLELLD